MLLLVSLKSYFGTLRESQFHVNFSLISMLKCMCVQGHYYFFSKSKDSVSVSMFETDNGLSLNFWYQRQKSQYQSHFFRQIYKVSVLVSKIDTNSKNWYWVFLNIQKLLHIPGKKITGTPQNVVSKASISINTTNCGIRGKNQQGQHKIWCPRQIQTRTPLIAVSEKIISKGKSPISPL